MIDKIGGVFLKPLSNQQIQDHWDEKIIQGFYELGSDYPELAAEIFAVAGGDDQKYYSRSGWPAT